jgi:diguanylate cyclase (GGDEF)-like protein
LNLEAADLDRIQQHIHALGRRDWLWWSLGILSALLLLGLGLGIYSFSPRAGAPELTVAQIFQVAFLYVFAVVVAGFNIHALLRSREAERLKVDLLLESLQRQLGRLQAMIDPVTRVYSRACLEEMAQKEIQRSERHGSTFALVLLDLDNFKQINDQFGHLMGDFVLSEAGSLLQACVRGSDLVFRYGGDEFVLLLVGSDGAGADAVVERIHNNLASWKQRSGEDKFDVGLSSGISLFAPGKTLQDLLHDADQAMYAMKNRHRAAATSLN